MPVGRTVIYRCVALDDQLYAAEIVAAYIRKTPDLSLVAATTDADETLKIIDEGSVDLLFLDIQMPVLNGIDLINLCGSKCKVILTTAYPQYALQGFDLDVVDYLLKPFSYERFLKAVNRFRLLRIGSEPTGMQTEPGHLVLKGDAKHKYHRVAFSDILFIKGLSNYIAIYTLDRQIITYMSLKEIMGMIPENLFCRVHRSYIISLEHIDLVDGLLVFIRDHAIPVSESHKALFYARISKQ